MTTNQHLNHKREKEKDLWTAVWYRNWSQFTHPNLYISFPAARLLHANSWRHLHHQKTHKRVLYAETVASSEKTALQSWELHGFLNVYIYATWLFQTLEHSTDQESKSLGNGNLSDQIETFPSLRAISCPSSLQFKSYFEVSGCIFLMHEHLTLLFPSLGPEISLTHKPLIQSYFWIKTCQHCTPFTPKMIFRGVTNSFPQNCMLIWLHTSYPMRFELFKVDIQRPTIIWKV